MTPKLFKNLLEKRKGKVIQKRSKQVATKKKTKKKKCVEEGPIMTEKMGGRRLATQELLYDIHSKTNGERELINPKAKTKYERNEKREHECQEQGKELLRAPDEVCFESVDSSKRSRVYEMETSRSNSSTARSYEPDLLTQIQTQAWTIEMQREIITELREQVKLGKQLAEGLRTSEEMLSKHLEEMGQKIVPLFRHLQSCQNCNSNLSNQSCNPNEDDKSGGGAVSIGGAGV